MYASSHSMHYVLSRPPAVCLCAGSLVAVCQRGEWQPAAANARRCQS